MQRVKSFEATGVAPNGRLYAGDLNAIQDAAAGKSDFTQTVDLGVLRFGDSALQLLKYGSGEARISGALRTDGVLRGLGGIIAGAYTTAQRDALVTPAYGTIILNTTANEYQWNSAATGSPAVWLPFVTQAQQFETTGVVKMWLTNAAPSGYLMLDGTLRSRATYAALNALVSAAGYPWGAGDGSTTFGLPDMRGRVPVGLGTHGDVDSLGENEGAALADRRVKHKHSVNDTGHTHSYTNPGSALGTGGAGGVSGPNSVQQTGSAATGITVGPQTASPTDGPAFNVLNFIVKT